MGENEQNQGHQARREIRAPYRVDAYVEIAGGSKAPVQTIDASERGIRVRSSRPLPHGAVQVQIPAPGSRKPLRVRGTIMHTRQIAAGLWESGIELEVPQPLLSAAHIDHAAYGQ